MKSVLKPLGLEMKTMLWSYTIKDSVRVYHLPLLHVLKHWLLSICYIFVHIVFYYFKITRSCLTLKAPRKNASENVVC